MSGLNSSSYGVKNFLSIPVYVSSGPLLECSCIKLFVRLLICG